MSGGKCRAAAAGADATVHQGCCRTMDGEEDRRQARLARMRGGKQRPSRRFEPSAAPSPLPSRRGSLAGSEASDMTAGSAAAPPASITSTVVKNTSSLADMWKLPPREDAATEEEPSRGLSATRRRSDASTQQDSLAALLAQRSSPPPASAPAPAPALAAAPLGMAAYQAAPAPAPAPVPALSTQLASTPAASQFRPTKSVQEIFAPPPSPLVTTSSMVSELANLRKLNREGAISEAEMSEARQKLLRRPATVAAPRTQSTSNFSWGPGTAPQPTFSQPASTLSSARLRSTFSQPSASDALLSKLHHDTELKGNPTQMLLQKLDNDMRSAYTARAPSHSDTNPAAAATSIESSIAKLSLAPSDTSRPTANTWHGSAHLAQVTSSAAAPAAANSTGVGFGFGQPSPRGEDDAATKLLRRLEGDIVTLGRTRSSHRVRRNLPGVACVSCLSCFCLFPRADMIQPRCFAEVAGR